MKLFTKYNRINISLTILTFVIGSIAFYFVLHYVLIRQLDDTLKAEQQEWVDYIKIHNQLPEIQNTKHQWITVEKASEPLIRQFPKNEWVFNPKEQEQEPVRVLSFTVMADGKLSLVKVYKSVIETEDLLKLIILVTIGMIAFILLTNYLFNRRIINRIWQPFYNTIDQIRDYEMAKQEPLHLNKEPIEEIQLLNESLNRMTERIHQDYTNLRSFTENASHEMQTPLAIIRTKVESLLQEAEGQPENVKQLLSIEDATLKLSKLHQSLLLLTKLNNRQFELTEQVDLTAILNNKLEEREELINAKHLKLSIHLDPLTLSFHQHLAEILISNLLNNMIKYTPENGSISIDLTKENIVLRNTSYNSALNKDKVFQRFYKDSTETDGTGLGLAIIKEICHLAGYEVTYTFIEQQHDFTIHFNS